MPMTLVEAAKLTQDVLLRGVIETIVYDSSVLQLLPFVDITGTALVYNREKTMPATSFYAVGDTWSEGTPTWDKITAALTIMGGDADVDNFIQQTYANPNDIEAEAIQSRAKSIAHKWSDTFFNGDTGADAKSFDGLKKLVDATQTVAAGAGGAALTLDMVDQLIDLVKPGRPDALLMAKRTRRKLSSLRRASGNLLETGLDAFGRHVVSYDGVPILVDDWIPTNEVKGASGAVCSSIYAVKFGAEGLTGLENGGVQIELVGELETKDATRHRLKWYSGLALYSIFGLARLEGINAS